MPRFGYYWRRASSFACKMYGYVTNAIRRVITRATRRRLIRRAQENEQGEQSTRRVEVRPALNILQKGAMKRCIYKIQANDTSVTSIKKLLRKLEQDMNYRGSPAALRRLMRELGLYPTVTANHKKYFVEKKRTRVMRNKYLENVTKYRNEGRPIIYTALSSVNLPKIKDLIDHRAVMAYAASDSGILTNALTVFRYEMPIEQWYYLIRYENYENWIRTYLMPNLPPNSVVVMRSAPWNKKIVKKAAMESWLRERCIPFESRWSKVQLRKLINLNKEKHEHKIIEDILKANNHTVLRLPAFHDDLNPLEVVWMHVQEYVAQTKTRNNLNHVVRLTHDKLASTDGIQMSEYCHKATLIESAYRVCGMHAETLKRRIELQQVIYSMQVTKLDLEVRDEVEYDSDDEEPENYDTYNGN